MLWFNSYHFCEMRPFGDEIILKFYACGALANIYNYFYILILIENSFTKMYY